MEIRDGNGVVDQVEGHLGLATGQRRWWVTPLTRGSALILPPLVSGKLFLVALQSGHSWVGNVAVGAAAILGTTYMSYLSLLGSAEGTKFPPLFPERIQRYSLEGHGKKPFVQTALTTLEANWTETVHIHDPHWGSDHFVTNETRPATDYFMHQGSEPLSLPQANATHRTGHLKTIVLVITRGVDGRERLSQMGEFVMDDAPDEIQTHSLEYLYSELTRSDAYYGPHDRGPR